jgi:hypothetical protein
VHQPATVPTAVGHLPRVPWVVSCCWVVAVQVQDHHNVYDKTHYTRLYHHPSARVFPRIIASHVPTVGLRRHPEATTQRTHERPVAMARQSGKFVGLALIVLLSSAMLASASSATVGAYPRDS